MSEKILKGLREAVLYFDEDEVKRLSEEAVEAGKL